MIDADAYLKKVYKRIGPIELRGQSTILPSCISSVIRFAGGEDQLTDLLSVAPQPIVEETSRFIKFFCRRVGLTCKSIKPSEIENNLTNGPVLVTLHNKYSFVIFAMVDSHFVVGMPGYKISVCMLSIDSEIFVSPRFIHSLCLRKPGPRYLLANRRQHLWMLEWKETYSAHYNVQAAVSINREFRSSRLKILEPKKMNELSSLALLDSHASIAASTSRFYGVFRSINTKRDKVFFDHRSIKSSIEELLIALDGHRACSVENAINRAAMFLTDFLTIHPFLNGNRRMGMVAVDCYLAREYIKIAWSDIQLTEIYYAVRLASSGHIANLTNLMRKNLVPLSLL